MEKTAQTNINRINNIISNVNKVIIGKEREIKLLLVALFSEGHVLLEDVPGTGKTVLAKTLAASLGCQFSRIQFTPDVLPSDITGVSIFNQKINEFEFRKGPIMTNVLLADEINRATPRTQSSLLEAMAEKQVTADGKTYKLDRPFFVIATQNPVESHGTFPLPDAQMDRFLMKISLGYPNYDQELLILRRFRLDEPLDYIRAVMTYDEIIEIQRKVREIDIHEDVEKYLLHIVRMTREHTDIEIGISPRGSIALMRAAQAMALIEGRSFCLPDDIKGLAVEVLAHRITLTMEAQIQTTPELVIQEIVQNAQVPLENGIA
ncbi:AAA family ATPase [Bacillus sp. CGMCC 1.16607]|uniref:AAA family ATPase n=1 Tax=Bacillus sp. CGMCC 1.16607 TaxID=3351842 RepID=UPI003644CAC3